MPKTDSNPRRLPRKESFFGIHFDFHAEDKPERRVGANTTRDAIQRMLDATKPDYIQFDTKGHPGLSSYPTKVGYPAPSLVGDPLAVVREVTAENGVALYAHHSGVWDTYAISKNPEWAIVNPDGSRHPDITSTYGGYRDTLFIPQIRELALDYGLDGVWIDGDCWPYRMDYHPDAVAEFLNAYPYAHVPRTPSDPGWDDFQAFSREVYRRYFRGYVDEIHGFAPEFQICNNWAFCDHMPEPITADVDFLSGDAHLGGGYYSRVEARLLSSHGKTWDIMSWGHSGTWPDTGTNTTKSAIQLMQEAASVIALGGGYQAVFNQKKDGTIIQWGMPLFGEVAEFVRARAPFCRGNAIRADIAVLHSSTDQYAANREELRLFRPPIKHSIRGMAHLLLDIQATVELMNEEDLLNRLAEHRVVVLPDTKVLLDGTLEAMLAAANDGGVLVAAGPDATRAVAELLGLETVSVGEPETPFYVEFDGELWGVQGRRTAVIANEKATVIGRIFHENDTVTSGEPAAVIVPHGRGSVVFVPFDLGEHYFAIETSRCRRLVKAILAATLPDPLVTVSGSRYADVAVTENDEETFLHLVNSSGPQFDRRVWVFDEILPIGPLVCELDAPRAPASVTLEPGARPLDFTVQGTRLSIDVPRIDIYDIVRIAWAAS